MTRFAKGFLAAAAPTLWAMAALVLSGAPNGAAADDEAARPIAVVEGTTPGARTEILSLKRSEGGMLTLRYALVNASGGDAIPFNHFLGCCGSAATTLIDYVNRKKYLVITDSNGECLCTAIRNSLNDIDAPRRILFAKFPAPPDSVSRIAVLFTGAEPVDDVPIGR